MWIDTHCHLDAAEFCGEGLMHLDAAVAADVSAVVVPAVHAAHFEEVIALAAKRPQCWFALGIHPLYIAHAQEADLHSLREMLARLISDDQAQTRLVAMGEIGLDFFVRELCTPELREKQEFFYAEQLKIARAFALPVLLHVRRSVDVILKYLRKIPVSGGIAHAFNGSRQQADQLIALHFKLGFGGAMTYPRALQIRRLARELPIDSLVLETDAPDMPPAWRKEGANSPNELPRIGAVLAELRGIGTNELAAQTSANARQVLPRLNLSTHA